MATIAELQIKVDSTETERGTKALLALAEAADKAAAARKRLNDIRGGGGGGGGPPGGGDDSETRRTKSLSEAIDAQERKLAALARQRKALNDSPLRTEDPERYKRLNEEIDSRTELVRRQGNALDNLARQAKREQEQRERAAAAAQRIAEREARQAQQKEEREARNAALAQRRLDATISSLSRQVKAQEDYNRTVAQLNAARAPTTGTASLGQAQYETYVRQAAAIRDAALAQADNSREIERAQRLYDASVASLGKVERAQATYTRDLKASENALRLNLITQEQYNTQLTAIAAKRDAAIEKANSTASADARVAAQLKSLLSAYDPVLRATQQYIDAQQLLKTSYDSGAISVGQYISALRAQKVALDAVKASQPNSPQSQAKEYQNTLDRLLPVNAQLRALNEAEQVLIRTRAQGKVTTEAQIKDYERATAAIAAERKEIERRSQTERRGNSAKQDAAALRGLPAQFTDVVVSLQGGQAPLTVLLQQGGQVKDLFGGIVPALKAVGGALLALVTPWTVAAAGLATVGYAFLAARSEITEFNKAAASSNNFSGVTTAAFQDLQKAVSGTVGTLSLAAETLTLLERSGKVTSDNFEAIAVAATKFSRVTGKAVSDIVDEFASLGKDPVQSVITLDEKYKFLTGSVYLQIAALQRQGDTLAATTLAQNEAAKGVESMADRILPNLSLVEKGWKLVTDAVKGTRDAIINFGREAADPVQAELDSVNKKLSVLGQQKIDPFGLVASRKADLNFQREALEAQVKWTKDLNSEKDKKNSLDERARQTELDLAKSSKTVLEQNMTSVERYTLAISALETQKANAVRDALAAGTAVDPEVVRKSEEAIDAYGVKLKEAKEQAARGKGGASPVDSREVQEVKSNLNVITSQYDAAYKKITALGAANVVSQEATFASQKALLEQQKNAVTGSYDEQIAAIKKLQGVKGNNASQNISLDNQLTRAEDARLKAMQDIDAKMEVLATAETGRLQKRTDAIEAYNEALRTQIDNVKTSGERAVSAVGQGDRQTTLNANLADVDRQFAKDQASLAKQLSKGMDPVEYAANLKNLTEAHNEMTAQILRNDADIQAANADWTNGFTKAIQNLADEANNVAGAVNTAFTGAFTTMGDALGTFVTTGKLDFKSLASSILSDMAKIAARAATNAALSSLFGAASSAFGGGAAAAPASLGSTAAGYSSTYFPQAKGGGWTGGTQFFAQGGAFTNSIVSSPTAFGMSGGGRGVMGEAGPEAIIPLARASDGSLGVRLVGGAGNQASGGVNVYVTIDSNGSVNTETDRAGAEQFGKEIGTIIESKYRLLLASDLKDGGAIKNAIKAG